MKLRRRHQILGLLLSLTGLVALGVSAWLQSVLAAGVRDGIEPLALTVRANGLAYVASVFYVLGAVLVHAAVAAWAYRRSDREAWIGVCASAVIHAIGLVALGVIAPPG